MTRADRDAALLGLVALVVGLVLLLTSGCGSAIGTARALVITGAEAVTATDAELAVGYRDAAVAARSRSSTAEEYRAAIAPWDVVHDAQQAAIEALRGAESAIDTWEAVDDERPFLAIIGCAVNALRRLLDVIRVVGVAVPALVENTASLIGQYAGHTCRETQQ